LPVTSLKRPADTPEEDRERLRVALPVKGRLREPSVALLEHAGFAPDAPDERALAFTCGGAPVEVLLVRAADIPEYVQDGAVDCGITGADLVRERAAGVRELVRLGYGPCSLEPAVLTESAIEVIEELDGLRVATSYPRLSRELLAERGVAVDLVDVTGSVEVAPRLGLADAIIDLVSSGNTLRTNGLRSLGPLFSSEAVLIGPDEPGRGACQLASVFRSVVEARASRYLMLNAPESALDEICKIVPGSRAPSVLPLSEPGMVAVHALVPSREVWRLLPRLEAAGASSILLVPVERLVP
jgi:ATP phosphoribosyltransferase